jgi:hypothetical protein
VRKICLVAFAAVAFACSQSAYATDAGICEIRAAILGAAAQDRDKGVSRKKAKAKLGKKLAGMSGYIDLVYDQMKTMSPKEVAEFTKFACSRE